MTQNLSIAYLNQYLLEHTSLLPALNDISTKLPGLIHGRNEFVGAVASSWYNRIGKDTMFCKTPGLIEFNKSITDYSNSFAYSFEQVSDQRCIDLRASHWHKPWVIQWSGGIDSTVIMTSILRNIPPGDFKNIRVWCNNSSIYENPKFFLEHIKPNFEIISDYETLAMLQDDFIFAGESGYVLGIEKHKIHAERSGFDDLGQDLLWADNRDQLVAYCDTVGWPSTSKHDFSNWLYNAMEENIRSTGLPINTVSEWWWWLLFNHHCSSNLMQHIDHYCLKETHHKFLENFVPWFHSDLYQRWGIHNLDKITKMQNKDIAKQYIHTVFKNEIYLNFKTKVISGSRPHYRVWFEHHSVDQRPRNWDIGFLQDDRMFCVLNNGDFLYLDRDLDQIIELLPQHINLDSLDYL
jgi:hypothetical protein